MVLGQALVAQGKYADAVTAFGQVTGGGPATRAHHPPMGGLRQGEAESARGTQPRRRRRNKPRGRDARNRPALFPPRAEANPG